ncbi:hypothetical protein MLD38_014747 [Melastoma candidum]|uniref:Uncharacterized protein n=1 Tax=Melastoma candidum TaxID=119954 RepID=A0ACB9RD44_9MYRT|nr:hypothetical protein MLD38_014747 [Melastoma candidum]
MEEVLFDAAMKGEVPTLHGLLRRDPLLLDRIAVSCAPRNPLHTAALVGQADFVNEVLTLRPELATEFDSEGNTPLHLASAKGHASVVDMLLRAGQGTAMVRNHEGKMPLHLAVAKGRVDVVRLLVKCMRRGELTVATTDRSETVVHVCAGRNRIEVLRMLVDEVGIDGDLANMKDCDGNCALHIAVAKKHVEMIKLLLSVPGLDVNVPNSSYHTALDILRDSPRDLGDMEIETALINSRARSFKDLHPTPSIWDRDRVKTLDTIAVSRKSMTTLDTITVSRKSMPSSRLVSKRAISKKETAPAKPKNTDWLGRKRSALMVVASLIATVAFQAAITPPGGVWQSDATEDSNGNPLAEPIKAGTAIMSYTQKPVYGLFMIFNTIAFLASLSIILLLVSGLPMKRRRWMWIQMVIMWIAITAQVVTYFISLRNMSPDDANKMLRKVTETSVLAWLCLMLVVFIGNVVRMNMWLLRKWGYLEGKDENSWDDVGDDDDNEG